MGIGIILWEPEHPGNLGSIARAGANFGFEDFILVDPKCDHLCEEACMMAKHAQDVLQGMRIADESVLNEFDLVVMTHGRECESYNMKRSMITPRDLVRRISETGLEDRKIAILFGPEGEGFAPDMLKGADVVVSIPTRREYSSMNLAMSVAVMLYELSLIEEEGKITEPFESMTGKQRDILMGLVEDTLESMDFPHEYSADTMRMTWRRMLGRSFLTQKEATALMGYLKKIQGKR